MGARDSDLEHLACFLIGGCLKGRRSGDRLRLSGSFSVFLRTRRDAAYDPNAWPASIPAVGQLLRDGLDLPAGARFTGFRYEATGGAVTADCLPGRECPAGSARFPFEPVIRKEGGRTILLVGFESTASAPRKAVVAGYSSFTRK